MKSMPFISGKLPKFKLAFHKKGDRTQIYWNINNDGKFTQKTNARGTWTLQLLISLSSPKSLTKILLIFMVGRNRSMVNLYVLGGK